MSTDLRFGGNLGGRSLRTSRTTGQTKIGANLVKQDQRGPESLEEETESTPQRIRTSNLRFRSRLRIAGINVVERLAAVRFTNMNIVLANRCRLSHFYVVSSGKCGLKW